MIRRSVTVRGKFLLVLMALLMLSIPVSAQNDDGEIDNCCYVNRQCTTQMEWINGWYAYVNNQCPTQSQQTEQPAGPPHQTNPSVYPEEEEQPPEINLPQDPDKSYPPEEVQELFPPGILNPAGGYFSKPVVDVPVDPKQMCEAFANILTCDE